MKLVIVESPAKCKSIQKYLGSEYEVLASVGHIVDLAKGGKFGIGIDLNNNLKPWYILQTDKLDVFDRILEAANRASQIYLAADMDREGESIAKHIHDRLISSGLNKPIQRITFGEITQKAILDAIQHPREIDMNLFQAQQARRVLDRIVGFMVSPFLMAVYDQTLSAGRVQSVAIHMIAAREHEIKTFKKQEFWNLFADVMSPSGEAFRVKYDGRLSNKADVAAVLQDVADQAFTVSVVDRKPKKESPPPPLTTLVMQQVMSKKFGFSAETTMQAAQSLYESGYTTYIRTDSVRMNDDAVASIRKYIGSQNYTVPKKPIQYEASDASADSHEAIRCTSVNNLPDGSMLTGDEKTLYDVIWRYSVASQMEPAVFDTLEVRVNCGRHAFRVSGKALSKKGYLEVLGLGKDTKIDIPDLNKGDVLTTKQMFHEQRFTQPPARYSEANLIKEMDAKKIGRPSTMATILKNIISRNYVEKHGNTYTPTPLGIQITDTLVKYFGFLNFDYSASMEKKLDDIAAGKESYDKTMMEFYTLFSSELQKACVANHQVSCERCRGIMKIRTNPKGSYLSCSGCRNFRSLNVNADMSNTTQ